MTKQSGSTKHETLGNLLGGLFVASLLTVLGVIGIAPNQANGALRAVAGGSGSAVVPVATCSTQGGIVYNGTQAFTCDPNLTYSTSGASVTVGSGSTTASGVTIGYSGTSGFGWIGATSLTPSSSNATLLVSAAGTTTLASNNGGIVFAPQGSGSSAAGISLTTAGNFNSRNDGQVTLGQAANRFGSAFLGSGGLSEQGTNVATAGATTINQATGSVTVASAASSVVVTNSTVVSTDNIMATSQQVDTTCSVKAVTPGSGTFTITMTAACTANNRVGFFVVHLTN